MNDWYFWCFGVSREITSSGKWIFTGYQLKRSRMLALWQNFWVPGWIKGKRILSRVHKVNLNAARAEINWKIRFFKITTKPTIYNQGCLMTQNLLYRYYHSTRTSRLRTSAYVLLFLEPVLLSWWSTSRWRRARQRVFVWNPLVEKRKELDRPFVMALYTFENLIRVILTILYFPKYVRIFLNSKQLS